MKRLFTIAAACILLLALCACGPGTAGQSTAPTPPAASAPAAPASPAPAASRAPASQPPEVSQAPSAEPSKEADPRAVAVELAERKAPVSELYEAIGQPLSADYAPGCVEPDSEDGELVYDGFTVYTVRTSDGKEYVYDVL